MWQTLVGPILNFFGKPIERYQETRRVVVEAKANRKAVEQKNLAEWENNVLIKSGVVLRWVCAIHLFLGMDYTIYAVFVGKDATTLWTALSGMPDWYAGLLATMFAFAFASSGIKTAGAALVSRWRRPDAQEDK